MHHVIFLAKSSKASFGSFQPLMNHWQPPKSFHSYQNWKTQSVWMPQTFWFETCPTRGKQILVEKNRCDPAHVNFAHHSFMGGANRNQENQVLDIKVTKEGSQGFIFKRNL
jgi:hypothetical protein